MATKYIQQASKQVTPIYKSQVAAAQAQIPAIQQLYNTLTQGLQGQYQTQLQTGVQDIVEDASARGVLRSTLPVDARTALTSELGAALQQSLGQLASQRATDIAGVRGNIADLRLNRLNTIYDLSNTLQSQSLAEREFQRDTELARMAAANSGGSGDTTTPSVAQQKFNLQKTYPQALKIARDAIKKNAKEPRVTESILIDLVNSYGAVYDTDKIAKDIYSWRRDNLGF